MPLRRASVPHLEVARGALAAGLATFLPARYPSAWEGPRGALIAAAAGCLHLPPRINLERMGTVGLIQLRSEAEGNIAEYATQVLLEVLLKSQPGARIKELGREGAAEEVAQGVVFLASPAASFVNGEVSGVNGGMYFH